MKHIALIPARAGSKSVVEKNLQRLGTKRLVDWSLCAALNIEFITDVYLSTDIESLVNDYQNHPRIKVIQRPSDLALDSTTMDEVVLHAIGHIEYGKKDLLWLLQPSSPLRKKEDFYEIKQKFRKDTVSSVISVKPCNDDHPNRCYSIKRDELLPLRFSNFKNKQDLFPVYRRNGCFYVFNIDKFTKQKDFYLKGCLPYLMSAERSLNIDSELDLIYGRALINENNSLTNF